MSTSDLNAVADALENAVKAIRQAADAANQSATTPSVPAPALPLSGQTNYKLLFEDNFDKFDEALWRRGLRWMGQDGSDGANKTELQWYDPTKAITADGQLHLTARKEAITKNGRKFDYQSGAVSTRDAFDFKRGVVEVRAQCPQGKGLWPAIWLLPAPIAWPPEIDILEVLGDSTDTARMNYHYGKDPKHPQWPSTAKVDTTQWHTYACEITDKAIIFFIDGKEVGKRFTDVANIPSNKWYLILNLAVGGDWPGAPDANTKFPSSFNIDYARIWGY